MTDLIRKAVALAAEAGGKARTLRFTISTGDVDRMGDTIDPAGWHLDEWKANPVILFGHHHDIPAIARGVDIGVVGGALKSTAEFPPAGLYESSATRCTTWRRAAFSGPRASASSPSSGSTTTKAASTTSSRTLMEWSIVNVPALPQAQISAAAGATAAVEKWLGRGLARTSGRSRPPQIELVDDGPVVLEIVETHDVDLDLLIRVIDARNAQTARELGQVAETAVRQTINRLRGRVD